MAWSGKGRGEVPRGWAAALGQVLDALRAEQDAAEFVLSGQHEQVLAAMPDRRAELYGIAQ